MNQSSPENALVEKSISSKGKDTKTKGALFAGLLAGLTASACCAGPLILLTLGVSGSWISNLSALEPFRPAFIILAVLLLVFAYRKIFTQSSSCDADAVCATNQGKKSQKLIFWITTAIIALSIAFPWYGPILFD